MTFKLYENAQELLEDNRQLMLDHEAETNVIYLNAHSGKSVEDGFFGAMLTEGDSLYLCIQCKPWPLVTFCQGSKARKLAAALAQYFADNNAFPGDINGSEDAVEFFVGAAKDLGTVYQTSLRLSLRELTDLNDVPVSNGQFRRADAVDFDFGDWARRFVIECRLPDPLHNIHERALNMQQGGELYCLMVNGQVVTMAAKTRKTANGQCIGWVYTPDDLRGNGYSMACMKHLTQVMLDDGNDFCFLYADKDNPVSNHIYEKLGYKKTGDFAHYMIKES